MNTLLQTGARARPRLAALGARMTLVLAASLLWLWVGPAQAQVQAQGQTQGQTQGQAQVQAQVQAPTSAAPTPASTEAPPASADPALERRVMALSAELRCLVCQNQTIADSNAELAVDLRNQVRDMLSQGQTDAEVLGFMTERYGDFVLYRPPLKGATLLLWFGPALLLVGGVGTLWFILYRRSRMAPEAFEPDPELDAGLDLRPHGRGSAAAAPEGALPSTPLPDAKT